MTDTLPEIRGTFTDLDLSKVASPTSKNPISRAHFAMVQELIRLHLPVLQVSPQAEEFEDVADYIVRTAGIVDRWLKEVGQEVSSNATVNVDLKVFTDQVVGAVQGNATHELDRCAASLRGENEDVRVAIAYGRTMATFIDSIFKDKGMQGFGSREGGAS